MSLRHPVWTYIPTLTNTTYFLTRISARVKTNHILQRKSKQVVITRVGISVHTLLQKSLTKIRYLFECVHMRCECARALVCGRRINIICSCSIEIILSWIYSHSYVHDFVLHGCECARAVACVCIQVVGLCEYVYMCSTHKSVYIYMYYTHSTNTQVYTYVLYILMRYQRP